MVEDDITSLKDTTNLETTTWRYRVKVGDTIDMKNLFDFSAVRDVDAAIERIIIEKCSSGVERDKNLIKFTEIGRKSVTFLNLLNDQIYTLKCEVIGVVNDIGDYQDIANSWARSEISIMAQYGILEESRDNLFKPFNPVSVKEFVNYLDKIQIVMNCDVDYTMTTVDTGISTQDWDYYSLYDFAGLGSTYFETVVTKDTYNKPITRGEAALLISCSLLANEPQRNNTTRTFVDISDSAVQAAALHLASLGVVTISGEGQFRPDAELTRQEMAKMLGFIIEYMN